MSTPTASPEMARPRSVKQPGAAIEPRIVAAAGRGRAFAMAIEAGRPLVDAVRGGFAKEGFRSGALNFGEIALGPMAYVMPALSTDGRNAAFYSDVFRPPGVTRTKGGALTFGRRDGAPYFHCHALWREADGRRCGGHLLPEETMVAEDAAVEAFGLDGAAFEAAADDEINFKVFGPIPAAATGARAGTRCLAVRLRPNQDFHAALESVARSAGWRAATLHGGVGSLIGAAFADGTVVENFATEVFVRSGAVSQDGAEVAVGLIDYRGGTAEGRLARGRNDVFITFELILAEAGGSA